MLDLHTLRSRRVQWAWATLLTAACLLPQLPAMRTMKAHGTDLLAFQLVGTSARADRALLRWGDAGRAAARRQLWWDFGFLAGYAMLLRLAATAVGARRATVLLGRAAAVSDACENVSLLVVVGGRTSQPWPAAATTFAVLKLAALGASLVAIGWAGLRRPS
jgi:hypothetical protein